MSGFDVHPGSGALPTASEWLTITYGPDERIEEGDITVTCEQCHTPVWLIDALGELDEKRRLYSCPTSRGSEMIICRGPLVRIGQNSDGTQSFRRWGDEMQLIARKVEGNESRIVHEF